ncbi:MAG TPA: TfoX/Sxy family protein [Burkholderiaceae bacterium]|jgi:DNA transformation protein
MNVDMSSDFANYVKELLAPLGQVRSKKMFGGAGIYINDLFCALVIDDTLYFKGDDQNEEEFAAGGCPPFVYKHKDGRAVSVRYYRPPEEAMDNPMEMARWARLGMAAALRKSAKADAKPQKKLAARSKKPGTTKEK